MSFKDKATAQSIKLDLHPANLIVRGIKKLYKPDRLRRLVFPQDRFVPSQQPTYVLSEIELEKWESEMLPRIDGSRSVAELVSLAGRPEPVVYAFLASMLALSVIDRKL